MYFSFTDIKLKPHITLNAHVTVQHSIYIPEPHLIPHL